MKTTANPKAQQTLIESIALLETSIQNTKDWKKDIERQLKTAEDALKKIADEEKAAKDKVIADKAKADEAKI